ncbi:hypothetical protein K438DRAFT_1784481 [Mycena galopus ATCC 62051]|nr:hypothetical protein K438DRAFT_1784481 [Mycena galopus ATCC 62051]
MRTIPSPPDLVPTISSGALPQTPASEWAEDINDLLAAHVTRTPVTSPGSADPHSGAAYLPSPNSVSQSFSSLPSSFSSASMGQETTMESADLDVGHDTHAQYIADFQHPSPSSSDTSTFEGTSAQSPPPSRDFADSTNVHTGHSPAYLRSPVSVNAAVSESESEPESELASHDEFARLQPRHASDPLSTTVHVGHSSTDLAYAAPLPASTPRQDSISLSMAAHAGHSPGHLRSPSVSASVPHPESSAPDPVRPELRHDSDPLSTTVHTGHSSTDLRVVSADTNVSAPAPEPTPRQASIPLSMTAHTGHSSTSLVSGSADARTSDSGPSPDSTPHQDSIPLSVTAHTGHSPSSLPSSALNADADSDVDLLSELSLDFIRRDHAEEEERPPAPHRASTPLSTTAHTGHRDSSSGVPPPAPPHPAQASAPRPEGEEEVRFGFTPDASGQFVQSPPALSPRVSSMPGASTDMDRHGGGGGGGEEEAPHRCPFKCAAVECTHRVNARLHEHERRRV